MPLEPYYEEDGITIYCGDCREVLPGLGKVSMVLTDPPYGKVKGDFDHEWTNRTAMLADCKVWSELIADALNPNGTLYWFAWPSLAGRIESIISDRLNLLSHIVWKKPSSVAQKANPESLRSPMPETERIIMAEQYRSDNIAKGETVYHLKCDELRGFVFEPIREYLDKERDRAGFTQGQCNKALGNQMASHYFTQTQWTLPTEENYKKLKEAFNSGVAPEFLRRTHEDLRTQYEDLRTQYEDLRTQYEDLRRPFNLAKGDPKTDVWNFHPCSERLGHPTPKPLKLINFMVRISSKPGDTILDPFMGSGTTLVAAKQLGRKAIGIELEEKYCEIAVQRLRQGVLNL